MSGPRITVTVDSKMAPAFAAAGAVIGLVASLLVGPAVSWLLERIDTAPAPLRLIDQLPLIWSMPLLTLLGAFGGWVVFSIWNDEVGRVVVDQESVRLESKKSSSIFSRQEIAEIFLDKDELVIVDDRLGELSRTVSDNGLAEKLTQAFTSYEYPWAGTKDPRDDAFTDWVDRSPGLDSAAHSLLRARRRALTDGKTGEAESLRDELAERGVVVRDRGEKQQYRLLPQP
ncbi:hypothetical protein [Nesterenkonia muleiensis]|uniref:YqeB family protein n=1 Tax=Nesterenkonia muleiensis TaxID=2282648 RepID=UPI000E72A156|nr:hypothetical protein [Nesterenkonia muleiensis]